MHFSFLSVILRLGADYGERGGHDESSRSLELPKNGLMRAHYTVLVVNNRKVTVMTRARTSSPADDVIHSAIEASL
jgi:hypothetical protein